MRVGWIRTYSGLYVNLLDPKPHMIEPRDVAHHLSLECRWAGATSRHYSVAEHCTWVARITRKLVQPEQADLAVAWGLLHDAHEAYLKDIPTPLKVMLGEGYADLCGKMDEAILERVGISYLHPDVVDAVHRADAYSAWSEAKALVAPASDQMGVAIKSGKEPPDDVKDLQMTTQLRRPIPAQAVEQSWLSWLRFTLQLIGGKA